MSLFWKVTPCKRKSTVHCSFTVGTQANTLILCKSGFCVFNCCFNFFCLWVQHTFHERDTKQINLRSFCLLPLQNPTEGLITQHHELQFTVVVLFISESHCAIHREKQPYYKTSTSSSEEERDVAFRLIVWPQHWGVVVNLWEEESQLK